MSKEIKAPKTVEVKMLIPYGFIIISAVASGSFITGWHQSQAQASEIQAKATAMAESFSKTSK